MIPLISIDEHCYKNNGNYYVDENSLSIINGYLSSFESIRVAVRTKPTSADQTTKLKSIDDPRITIVPLPFFRGPKEYFKVFNKVKKAAESAVIGCDLAILRLPSTIGFVIWHSVQKKHIPYSTEIVADPYDQYLLSNTLIKKVLLHQIYRWQVAACNNAIGVSCVTSSYLQKRYYSLRENSIVGSFSDVNLSNEFFSGHRQYDKPNVISIIHVSNYVDYSGLKGQKESIDVLSEVIARGYNAQLIFVGNDVCGGKQKLADYSRIMGVEKNVFFFGFLTKEELRKTMLNADIFLFPSKTEGLPRVIIEAMALGLPCIASPVGGISDLLNVDCLIDHHDIKGMSTQLISIIENKELYERISAENFHRSKNYSDQNLDKKRVEFYCSIKSRVF